MPSRTFIGTQMKDMIPIPQLYGSPYDPEKNKSSISHRGSCLSASFEMVCEYLLGRQYMLKSSTFGRSRDAGRSAYPNRMREEGGTSYYWNQATIHHYVWGEVKRMIELACTEYPNENDPKMYAKTFTKSGRFEREIVPDFRATENGANGDYLGIIIKSLQEGLPLILCEKGMLLRQFPNAPIIGWDLNQKAPPWPGEGHVHLKNIMRDDRLHSPHAIVITGIENHKTSSPRIRILDPAPSMELRENLTHFHSPIVGPRSRMDPERHAFFLDWFELKKFILEEMGLTVFATGRGAVGKLSKIEPPSPT
jgi:hypothetical protein